MKKHLILIIISLCFTLPALAQTLPEDNVDLERIVVTPYRTDSVSGYNKNNVEVIQNKNIGAKNSLTLSESFCGIDGVDTVGGGKFGSGAEGVYIRGALPRHTAYMLEGMKIYDPSNPSSYYIPAYFSTDGLERMEVIKTPLSSLYGSSAVGGAINFLVKTPQTKPYISYEQELGSFRTTKETVELGGKIDNTSYLLNVSRLDSKGFSKAKIKDNNPEPDGYQDTNITMKLVHSPDPTLDLGLVTRVIHSRTANDDDDDHNGIPEDDLNNVSWDNEYLQTAYLKKEFNPQLSYKVQGGVTSIYRKYADDQDGHCPTDNYVSAWYRGDTYQFSNNIEYVPFDFLRTLLGFDYTHDKMDSYRYDYSYFYGFGYVSDFPKHSTHSRGIFIENILTPNDNLKMDCSYRLEKDPIFKNHSVFKGGINYEVPHLKSKIYGSYSEGFKAPSLYDLFDPTRGNRNLKPEESKTWEAGISQPLSKSFELSASYFHSDFLNLIDFVYTNPTFWIGEFKNAAKGKSRGIELKAEWQVNNQLRFKTGYTRTEAEQDNVDDDTVTIFSRRTIRIPRDKAFITADWKYKKFAMFLDISYVGGRDDRIWVGIVDEFVKMKPYFLANLSANYNLQDNVSLFMRVENILDKNYERIKGFQEEPFAVFAGTKLKF